jgi:hypothetical protein
MELPAYCYFLLREAVRLYWPAVAFNLCVYFIWIWNRKTEIPIDLYRSLGNTRLVGNSRGFTGAALAFTIGIAGVAASGSYLPFYAALGAEAGTIFESFVKRRLGFKRGTHVWILDETDVILGATAFLLPVTAIRGDVFLFTITASMIGHYAFNTQIRPRIEKRVYDSSPEHAGQPSLVKGDGSQPERKQCRSYDQAKQQIVCDIRADKEQFAVPQMVDDAEH